MIFGFAVNEPIICMCWISSDTILLGLASGEICVLDVKKNAIETIQKCQSTVLGIYAYNMKDGSNSMQILIVVDLSSNVTLFDLSNFKVLVEYKLDYRCTCCCFRDGILLLGSAESLVGYCEINRMGDSGYQIKYKKSPLNSPISTIDISSDLYHALLGGVDGRCSRAILKKHGEFLLDSDLIFKAHKKEVGSYSKKEHI